VAARTPKAAVKVAPATAKVRTAIASLRAEGNCKGERAALEALVTAGITFPVALPSSCLKVSAAVRDAVAASLGIDAVILPFELAKDAPGRSTPESMRIYLAKYVLPAFPALAASWDRLLLAANSDGLPTLYPIDL